MNKVGDEDTGQGMKPGHQEFFPRQDYCQGGHQQVPPSIKHDIGLMRRDMRW